MKRIIKKLRGRKLRLLDFQISIKKIIIQKVKTVYIKTKIRPAITMCLGKQDMVLCKLLTGLYNFFSKKIQFNSVFLSFNALLTLP